MRRADTSRTTCRPMLQHCSNEIDLKATRTVRQFLNNPLSGIEPFQSGGWLRIFGWFALCCKLFSVLGVNATQPQRYTNKKEVYSSDSKMIVAILVQCSSGRFTKLHPHSSRTRHGKNSRAEASSEKGTDGSIRGRAGIVDFLHLAWECVVTVATA